VEFTEELPSWAVILSGLGLIAAGVAWRLIVDRRPNRSKDRDYAHEETGEHRSSYLLVIVGIVWTGYGVVQAL
jgi:hypothetical protein